MKVKVVHLKMLIFKAKLSKIRLALNNIICSYYSSKSHTPDLPQDRTNQPTFPVSTNCSLGYFVLKDLQLREECCSSELKLRRTVMNLFSAAEDRDEATVY